MLSPGDLIDLLVERPAAGGRMIARHEGQIVFVAGAIPGEKVAARVERVERRLAFARVHDVLEPSPDRREPAGDPLCGGCLYAHIAIERQRAIKAEVIADAFARIGRQPLNDVVPVAASAAAGYRMRARLHVRGRQVGFYREGTHELCDGSATRQLRDGAFTAAARVAAAVDAAGAPAAALAIAEDLAGDQRAMFVELTAPGNLSRSALEGLLAADLASIITVAPNGVRLSAGAPVIADPLGALTDGRAAGRLVRSAESFFQANRFLLPALVVSVIDSVLPEGGVLDLYAGVGLFAASLAGCGRANIAAVEGAGPSGNDLQENARAFPSLMTAVVGPVERFMSHAGTLPATVIVDPPRTGLSPPVLQALVARAGPRIVYVSCDPPTMARDARGLIEGGYELQSLRAFDLFPNTPHVETVGVFRRG
jgi:tRNA/tmRNA/rRNA uracil-C5-methylase (TrmA/RlmC/RlmD family)